MSDQCGGLEFVRGGVIHESTINASEITNSVVQASVLRNVDVESLASIDAASAQVIADAMSRLSPAQLKALAEAIHAAHAAEYSNIPAARISNDATLPTQICGAARDVLLGTPDAWEKRKDNLVAPLYRAG